MELLKPNVSEDMAKEIAKRLYGFEVLNMKRFVSYDDQNFYIKISPVFVNPHIDMISDYGYTLKITNTQKSGDAGHFDSMHATMAHLYEKGLRVPTPVKNIHGRTWSLEKVPLLNEDELSDSKLCGVHLLTFIPGMPLSSVECKENILYEWGILLAKFHKASEDFKWAGLRDKFVFWNLENLPKIKDFMGDLPQDKQELVFSVLKKYSIEIEQNLEKLPKGVIHGDFNENNVLVRKRTEESVYTVDGILDFEDVHESTYMWDVAVMMAYALLTYNKDDVLIAPGIALAGYQTVRALNDLELSLLKTCVEGRLCQSLVMGAHSFSLNPDNTYLLDSSKTGWTKLRLLKDADAKDLNKKWKNYKY